MEKETTVRVVCCVDDTYARYLPTLLYSLAKTNSNAEVYVIYKELSPMVQDMLASLSQRLDQLTIILKAIDDRLLQGISNSASRLPLTAYYRILAPLILPETVERVLYLDVDIVVNASLVDLFRLDMKGNAIAGVKELEPYDYPSERLYAIGLTEEDAYINSGVLLIDVAKWRNERIVSRIIAFAEQHADGLVFGDQDIINLFFKNQTLLLDKRYNYCRDFMREAPYELDDLAILHFNYIKPWVSSFRLPEWLVPAAALYRHIRNEVNQLLNAPPLVSIIVPVFNMRNQILETLESIGNQLFGPFEVIVVDAGSSDGTRDIILAYAKKDCRVRYFEHPCDTLGQAYYFGLEQSVADRVTVVYPWGALEEQYLLQLYGCLDTPQVDMVVGGSLAYRGGNGFYHLSVEDGQVLEGADYGSYWQADAFQTLSGKLFKRSLLTRVPETVTSERDYLETLYQTAHHVVTKSVYLYIRKELDDSMPYLANAFIALPKPKVSIILVLRETFSNCQPVLETLLSQRAMVGFEVVVIDLKGKETVLDNIQGTPIQWVRLPKTLTDVQARAYGLANSQGDDVIFLSDRIELDSQDLLWQCEIAKTQELDMICQTSLMETSHVSSTQGLRSSALLVSLLKTPRRTGQLLGRKLLDKAIHLGFEEAVLSDSALGLVRLLFLSDKIGLLPLKHSTDSQMPPQLVQEFQSAYDALESLLLELLLAGCDAKLVRDYAKTALQELEEVARAETLASSYATQAFVARLSLLSND